VRAASAAAPRPAHRPRLSPRACKCLRYRLRTAPGATGQGGQGRP
jgi:hypothetical protein